MRSIFHRQRGLVILNLALLGAVVFVAFIRPAGAQNAAQPSGGSGRARGEYTMVSGKTSSGGGGAIYIVDVTNQEMVALRWDPARQSLIGVGYRDLAADTKVVPGR
ncbi:MAG: hypothetical protein JNK25_02015 [Phycisphaerae bacterium]|nr:hypothetical protein [Phycisphaerae bacterium]